MLNIGCHVSSGKGYVNMYKDTIYVGGNTFQFFTRNPRGGSVKEVDIDDLNKFIELSQKDNFAYLVAHAPYTLNCASKDPHIREFAIKVFKEDLKVLNLLPKVYYNFHPGSHVGQGEEEGISLIIDALNRVIEEDQPTMILLETMAGKGSEIGYEFEQIRKIMDGVIYKDKVGVCLDTCHVSDGGYDLVNDLEGVLNRFNQVIGLEHLKAIHLNDSKNIMGARKDRHEKIGEGYLGKETFRRIINHPKLKDLPFILETPNELDGYKQEIELLKGMKED